MQRHKDNTTDNGTDAGNSTMYTKGDTLYTLAGTYGTNILHITQRRIQRKGKLYSRYPLYTEAKNSTMYTKGDTKKYKVYVKNDKGNVVKVEYGDPNMSIKRDDPARRKAFRARHNCDNPGPKTKARYWSCKFWEKGKTVTDLVKG